MPAPHDQRFCIIFKVAQKDGLFSDDQLLALFESVLDQVFKADPGVTEGEAITRALRTWCHHTIPEKGMPGFLDESFRLKRRPQLGDAVVVPSQAKGTFWYNRETRKVQWVWYDPDPDRPGQILHTEPSFEAPYPQGHHNIRVGQYSPRIAINMQHRAEEATLEAPASSSVNDNRPDSHGLGSASPASAKRNHQVQKEIKSLPDHQYSFESEQARHFTPGAQNHRNSSSYLAAASSRRVLLPNNSNNCKHIQHEETTVKMSDSAPSVARERSVGQESNDSRRSYAVHPPSTSASRGGSDPDKSTIRNYTHYEYYSIKYFIAVKAEKAGLSPLLLETDWDRCLDHCWREFISMGRAYAMFKAEYNFWITLFPDELFPGRDPLTEEFQLLTGREVLARHNASAGNDNQINGNH